LRHRLGWRETKGTFARCPHCDKVWTSEELIGDFIQEALGVKEPCVENPNKEEQLLYKSLQHRIPKQRIDAEVIQFQRCRNVHVSETPTALINARFNHHVSCHTKGCFRCSNKGTAHICGPHCECRYRLPDIQRRDTQIRTESQGVPWYLWTGEEKKHPLITVQPRRGKYDEFQNVSCAAISESKLACNSNVNVMTEGPISQYTCKYTTKDTQKDDQAKYAEVDKSIKAITGRVHESDRGEAIRLISRAAFAHNKSNVVSAPMASYLLRHRECFYFSHDFMYCPLTDMVTLHNTKQTTAILKFNKDGTSYF